MSTDVTTRPLFGEDYEGFELSVSACEKNAYGKLLRAASRLVKERKPLGVSLSGPYWRETGDQFVLSVTLTTSPWTPAEDDDDWLY